MKIKRSLINQKKYIEGSEQRRKQREYKKMSKQIQAQKLQEKARAKKEAIAAVKKWRKEHGGKGEEFDVDTVMSSQKGGKRGAFDKKGGASKGNGRGGANKKAKRPGKARRAAKRSRS
eukprot:GEZU01015884.1.p1 GENE.GEZU01015884.1~~GEZU01015884.1.p1  ORF type:complete len:118 (+),score=42.63 GEZU01015884.1:1-354(+)